MEKITRRKALLGLLALGSAALFFVVIFMAGKKENLFQKTFTISAIFKDVNGLKKGNYVYYSGVRGGIVETVTFINDSMIKIDMRMDKKLQALIKKDARVYISTEGLVGDKIIEIKPVHYNMRGVEDNDTLVAMNPYDFHEVTEKLIATNENVEVISGNLAELSKRINKPSKGLLQSLATDSSMTRDFKTILQSLKTTGNQVSALSSHLEKITRNVDIQKGTLGALLQDTTMKNDLSRTLANLDSVSHYSLKIAESLNSNIRNPGNENALSVLMKDSTFARDLREGMANFRTSTAKLDQNMEALQHNFLFKKYFKEQKKNSSQNK